MKAAVHLGNDYEENLRVTRNTEFSEIRSLFSITQKLVLDQKDEILGANTIDWDQTPWLKSTWVHERAIKLSTAKIFQFFRFGAVLWRQNCRITTICAILDGQIGWFTQSTPYRGLDNIDGEPVVFEWKIFPGQTTLKLLS